MKIILANSRLKFKWLLSLSSDSFFSSRWLIRNLNRDQFRSENLEYLTYKKGLVFLKRSINGNLGVKWIKPLETLLEKNDNDGISSSLEISKVKESFKLTIKISRNCANLGCGVLYPAKVWKTSKTSNNNWVSINWIWERSTKQTQKTF